MARNQAFLLAAALLGLAPAAAEISGRDAFNRLQMLEGAWRGHVTSADGPQAEARYEKTAAGNAVAERLFPGTPHEMLTVYYLDGEDLVLTHYCATGNHPRMRLDPAASSPERLVFAFDEATNFSADVDPHMHEGRIEIQGADRLEADWAVFEKGREAGRNRFFLERSR